MRIKYASNPVAPYRADKQIYTNADPATAHSHSVRPVASNAVTESRAAGDQRLSRSLAITAQPRAFPRCPEAELELVSRSGTSLIEGQRRVCRSARFILLNVLFSVLVAFFHPSIKLRKDVRACILINCMCAYGVDRFSMLMEQTK